MFQQTPLAKESTCTNTWLAKHVLVFVFVIVFTHSIGIVLVFNLTRTVVSESLIRVNSVLEYFSMSLLLYY